MNLLDPPDLTGRQIVAGCTTPTRHLSKLIEKILKPLVEKSYVKDDWDYLKQLPSQVSDTVNLFSCDIKSLYTNISHELGIEAIKYWINKRQDLIKTRITDDFIIESIKLILANNNFLFNDVMYCQRIGTAMGHVFAPPYACLVIGYLEEEILFKYVLHRHFEATDVQIIQLHFQRYMDDGSTFLPKSIKCDEFLCCLNSLQPSVEYTLEPAVDIFINDEIVQKLDFLDITINLFNNGRIETDIHYKPTNLHKHLLYYNSFHPDHCKINIPFNLAKRIIVFFTNSQIMESRLTDLKQEKGIHNARLQGPAPKLVSNKNIIPLVTTYMSNLDTKLIMKSINALISNTNSDHLHEVLSDVNVVMGYK